MATESSAQVGNVVIRIQEATDLPKVPGYYLKRSTPLGKLMKEFCSRYRWYGTITFYHQGVKVEPEDTAQTLGIEGTALFVPHLDFKMKWHVDPPRDERPTWAPLEAQGLDMSSTDSTASTLCVMRFTRQVAGQTDMSHSSGWAICYMGKRVMARVDGTTGKLWFRIDRYFADRDVSGIDIVTDNYAHIKCISRWVSPAELLYNYPAMQQPFNCGDQFLNYNALTETSIDTSPSQQGDRANDGINDDKWPEHEGYVDMQLTAWSIQEDKCKAACRAAGAMLYSNVRTASDTYISQSSPTRANTIGHMEQTQAAADWFGLLRIE